jgi:hypothetical protein
LDKLQKQEYRERQCKMLLIQGRAVIERSLTNPHPSALVIGRKGRLMADERGFSEARFTLLRFLFSGARDRFPGGQAKQWLLRAAV